MFTRTGGTWTQEDHLFKNGPSAHDGFGGSVAISGDTIFVGTGGDDLAAGYGVGSVYAFTRTGGTWSLRHHLFANDAVGGDLLGEAVSVSGDTVVAGAKSQETAAGILAGAAYVFGPPLFRVFVGDSESESGDWPASG